MRRAKRSRDRGEARGDPAAAAVNPLSAAGAPAADVARRVGRNLRRWRHMRGMSLEKLAAASGVSRAALSHIEASHANPTVTVLCKVALGLDVPLSNLLGDTRTRARVLRRSEAHVLCSGDGRIESRSVIPTGSTAHAELYELRLAPHAGQSCEQYASGTMEIIIVLSGELHVEIGVERCDLGPGDAVWFEGDRPHTCENRGPAPTVYHQLILHEPWHGPE